MPATQAIFDKFKADIRIRARAVRCKMKPAAKKRWVEALRSGRYRQGQEQLCSQDKGDRGPPRYCCLGVLADLEFDGYWEPEEISWSNRPRTAWLLTNGKDDDKETWDFHLPRSLMKQVGLHERVCNGLIHGNDEQHVSFKQIADVIEAVL